MNDYLITKDLRIGFYAVRIIDVTKKDNTMIVSFEILADSNNWHYYREEKQIHFSLKNNNHLYKIKRFINITASMALKSDHIFSTSVKPSAAFNSVLGIEKTDKNSIIFYNLEEPKFEEESFNENVQDF